MDQPFQIYPVTGKFPRKLLFSVILPFKEARSFHPSTPLAEHSAQPPRLICALRLAS